MNTVNCSKMDVETRVLLFGEAFKDIHIKNYKIVNDLIHTTIIHNGEEVTLIGNPEKKLTEFLNK